MNRLSQPSPRSRRRRCRVVARALAWLLLGAGVSGAASAAGSAGCGQTPPSQGSGTVTVPGYGTRDYYLDLPSGYDENVPYPLMFAYHPLGVGPPPFLSTWGELFCSPFYGNFAAAVGSEGIFVCPEGLSSGSAQQDWVHPSDDDFFDALLAKLSDDLCVDGDRVFATGHSAGGFEATELGCSRGSVLRAIAPVSGGGPPGGCVQSGQVAAMVLHTDPDSVVSPSLSIASRDYFAGENGCNLGAPQAISPSSCARASEPGDVHETYAGCDSGHPVQYCKWDDVGHQGMWSVWAGGDDLAAPAIWEFFSGIGPDWQPLFSDGFEAGLGPWTSASGGVVVSTRSAHGGSQGAEAPVSSCSGDDTVTLPPPDNPQGTYSACSLVETLAEQTVQIGAGGAVFEAGEAISLANGFSVPDGTEFTAVNDPSLAVWSYVHDATPAAVDRYGASFWLKLDALSLAVGDSLDHFVGASAGGTVQFRLTLIRNGVENRLVLTARNDSGSYDTTAGATEIVVPAGWNQIDIDWAAGSGTGYLRAYLDGTFSASVEGLDNPLARVDDVSWGVVSGTAASSSGRLDMDDFASWQ